MRLMLTLSALGLLLTACTSNMSDASIHRHVVGVWVLDSHPSKIIENKSDGTIVVRLNGVETARGKWQIKNGYLIEGVGSSSVESNKVLSISGDKMVVLRIDGRTLLTLHRQ